MIIGATLSVVRQAAAGQISVGEFSVLTMGIGYVQSQLAAILAGVAGLYENLLHMGTLAEFLALPSSRKDEGDEWRGVIDTIQFDNVSYGYPSHGKLAVDSLSFTARRGESIAIVGTNGSGKSTLIRLLSRLAVPTSGRILINGQDASKFSGRSLQREISVMFQDHVRYSMTMRDNIGVGDVQRLIDEDAVKRAAQDSGVADFMKDWEAGYDTTLGQLFPQSKELSWGQWQRVALARLYFKRCSMYLLDEPTASLDIEAERRTAQYLRARSRDHIVIVVTHNPELIALVDKVLPLTNGRLTQMPSKQATATEQVT
ncbi:MAG TPA: ABC transporter ATP-binding protein [Vicinamibacterales bacterium]|nr:ABC transporter ATP-binding protein [Vicinamibacterales bacterium]